MYYVLEKKNQSFSGLSKSVELFYSLPKEKSEGICVQ